MTEEYAELEGFLEDEKEEDDPRDEPSDGGVREPKKPILPSLSGGAELEIEREEELDLLCCSNQ